MTFIQQIHCRTVKTEVFIVDGVLGLITLRAHGRKEVAASEEENPPKQNLKVASSSATRSISPDLSPGITSGKRRL